MTSNLYRQAFLVLFAVMAWQDRAEALQRTVCQSACDYRRIQDAINSLAGTSGNTVLVRSTYSSSASGETWPIQTLVIPGSIKITGEVNGSGVPISTVSYTGSGTNDMLIVVSPGSEVSNLRFVPANGNPVNRVIAAGANPGHLSGLTIRNVVIDFTSTWSAHNAIDLLADHVTIENNVISGVAANYVYVDGDYFTIANNTLNGFAGSVPRAELAIGFGADVKTSSQAVCSGKPTGYTITGNVIKGFLDGIHWCTGLNNNQVTNNRLEDIVGKAIETSGSQGTTIANNVISWTATPGEHGIGLSSNAYQRCDANVVANNRITGRPARDTKRGISIQDCVNTQITGNGLSTFGDVDGAIFFVMSLTGVTTRSLIQGNTVQDGDASGIVYIGTDTTGTAADSSIVRENVVMSHRRNGIIVQSVRGAGNIIAGNIVRTNNVGLFANTHGLNLHNLANTKLDRNQALDTRGSGAGFFVANSQQVSGNCNTGTANGGGLLAQTNVSPALVNPVVNCRVGLTVGRDFDGDGNADIAVYRHSTGEWLIRRSTDNELMHVPWGCPTCDDIPAPANYTSAASATTDVAVYRYSTGVWYIRRSSDGSLMQVAWGAPSLGDVPVPANYSGTGLADIAVYRASTGEWYIRRASDGSAMYVSWGCPACGDMPVPADFDGDGLTDVAVYRRSTGEWFIRRSSNGSVLQLNWGVPTLDDLPVPSNYTQSGRADVAIYRAATGEWFIRRSTDGGFTYIPWGVPSLGDIPVPAPYSAPLTNVSVYRASRGEWFIRLPTGGVTHIAWGAPSLLDAPLTSR